MPNLCDQSEQFSVQCASASVACLRVYESVTIDQYASYSSSNNSNRISINRTSWRLLLFGHDTDQLECSTLSQQPIHPATVHFFSFRHRSRWPLFIREMRHTPFIWKWPYFACYSSSQDLCCCRKIDWNTTSNNLRRKIVKQSRLSAEVFKERKGWKLCTGPNKQHSIPTLVHCSFSLSHSLSLSPFCLSLSIYIHK